MNNIKKLLYESGVDDNNMQVTVIGIKLLSSYNLISAFHIKYKYYVGIQYQLHGTLLNGIYLN